jgi:hypothetical protein
MVASRFADSKSQIANCKLQIEIQPGGRDGRSGLLFDSFLRAVTTDWPMMLRR